MAKKSTEREARVSASALSGSTEKVEPTPCGIQFETDEDRKSHVDRKSCCNYTMYSSLYRHSRRV